MDLNETLTLWCIFDTLSQFIRADQVCIFAQSALCKSTRAPFSPDRATLFPLNSDPYDTHHFLSKAGCGIPPPRLTDPPQVFSLRCPHPVFGPYRITSQHRETLCVCECMNE